MYKSKTTCRKLYILCCLITHPQNGGKGGGALIINFAERRGAYSKGALIRRGHLFEGVGALNRRCTVIYISAPTISTSFDFRELVPVKGRL